MTPVSNHPQKSVLGRIIKALFFFVMLSVAAGAVLFQFSNTLTEASFPGVVFGTEVEVSSRTQAKILRIEVDQNQQVKKGDVLVELYDEEFAAQIKNASNEIKDLKAAIERARVDPMLETQEIQTREKMNDVLAEIAALEFKLPTTEGEIKSASASLAILQDQLDRARKLFDAGAMLVTDLESRQLALNQAGQNLLLLHERERQEQLQLNTLKQQVEYYKVQIEGLKETRGKAIIDLESSLRQKQGEMNTLMARKSEMILTSPQDGIVSRVFRSVGEIASTGTPIMNIYTGERLWVEVYPNAENAGLLRPGDRMQVLLDSTGWIRLEAHVQGILPVMQAQSTTSFLGSTESSYAVVLVEFDNLEKAKSTVRKGQNVTAVLLPQTAGRTP
ncbi:MAG: HlyD family efflux transporter periplasmic adaptor subunit [Candidatus Omnitrophica bacterium]|nr:HlyD family efflux transporter periplasmic adaptor subunit [Candidatus Omnitrophota bacterium]